MNPYKLVVLAIGALAQDADVPAAAADLDYGKYYLYFQKMISLPTCLLMA